MAPLQLGQKAPVASATTQRQLAAAPIQGGKAARFSPVCSAAAAPVPAPGLAVRQVRRATFAARLLPLDQH
jgi:hypothetical protein